MYRKGLKEKIVLWVSLPLVATALSYLAICYSRDLHNHLAVSLMFLSAGIVFTAFSAWRIIKLITGRQLLQAQQLAFLQTLIDTIPNPIYYKDVQGRYLGCNSAFESATGAKRSEVIGKKAHDFFVQELADIYCKGDDELLARGGEQVFGSVAPYADGTLRHVIFHKATYGAIDGSIGGLVGIYMDISEQKKLEEELVKLTQAVTQSPTGIIITDTKGVIEYINPRFTEMTGYTMEDVLGEKSTIFKWVDAPANVYRELIETIRNGDEWRGRFHSRRKNGELYWEDTLVAPITNSAGMITNFLAMKEDVSERVRLEEQLHYSQKMDSIGRMAGGLAHDFNNILTAISGYAGIMEFYAQEESPLTLSLKQIRGAVDRAAGLVQGLLDFSRRQRSNPLPVNLNDIVTRVGKLIESLVGDDITVHNFLSEAPLEVLAVSVQVEQLIMHLASNARDAMPQGGELWIGTRRTMLDQEFVKRYGYGTIGEYALLTVTDNGIGMDAETLEKIYEPFFTTKGVGKGSGLGLSVVYGCVKQHKGFLTCYSEPGKGTQFNIYFPLKFESAESGEEEPVRNPILADRLSLRGSETLLLVEDDPDVLGIIKSLLEEFGYSVLIAGDGNSALQIFREGAAEIKMIITDAIMPHKNGWDTFREMQSEVPWLKGIFISGYTREALIEKGMMDETATFLPKPIAPMDLLRTVREVLDR
ncbi:MAG: PAS domain S-box protein [Geobacter sp.]|nr:PAS domain S-box protein [Geobacter sp.]